MSSEKKEEEFTFEEYKKNCPRKYVGDEGEFRCSEDNRQFNFCYENNCKDWYNICFLMRLKMFI